MEVAVEMQITLKPTLNVAKLVSEHQATSKGKKSTSTEYREITKTYHDELVLLRFLLTLNLRSLITP